LPKAGPARRASALEYEVLPFDPAEVSQRLNERGPVAQLDLLGLIEVHRRDVSDVIDLAGLLRVRHARGHEEARHEKRQDD
jgi:hypothetical protein